MNTQLIDNALATAEKIVTVRKAAASAFIEREDCLDAFALALSCGEHLAMLAKPGTAKTALGDYFAQAFGCPYWYTALGVESTSDELFGPTDPMSLDKALWTRKLAGMATHTIAFIDEAGKGSQEVQNLMLAVMEERKLPVGDARIQTPLHMAFCASNETLDENPAFWDRWLMRVKLRYIQDAENFLKMLESDIENPPHTPISSEDFCNLRTVTREMALNLSEPVKKTMGELWYNYPLRITDSHQISDRRWKRILRVAAGSALMRGNVEIEQLDLGCAKYILWHDSDDTHIQLVTNWVESLTNVDVGVYDEKKRLVEELETAASKLSPNDSTKGRSTIVFRAKQLQRDLRGKRGKQWQDLNDRCVMLQTKLSEVALDF